MLFSIILCVLLFRAALALQPSVTLKDATYIGSTSIVAASATASVYIGLPFAQKPERFRAAKRLSSGQRVRLATAVKPVCPQDGNALMSAFTMESEDCLYLNIFTPDVSHTKSKAKKAVLVFFHGGGLFMGGIASSAPLFGGPSPDASELAVKEDIIVVAPAYRLNVFGFPGAVPDIPLHERNVGFRDQKLALEWVQENIAAFGGDPAKVTISGVSGGAISVDSHLVTELDNPPFRAAISSSGGLQTVSSVMTTVGHVVTGVGSVDIGNETAFNVLANAVGCGDAKSRLSCMQNTPVADLKRGISMYNLQFLPVPDGGRTMWQDWDGARRAGKQAKVPVMIGNNAQEALIFSLSGKLSTKSLPQWANIIYPANETAKNRIISAYAHGPGTQFATASDAILQLHSDMQFACITTHEADLIARTGAPTYRYVFNGSTPYIGQMHGGDLMFLWGSRINAGLSKLLQNTWGSFVRDPSLGPGWSAMNSSSTTVKVASIGGADGPPRITNIDVTTFDRRCEIFRELYSTSPR